MADIGIWFPFYIGDYLKDTMALNAEKHGVYLLLMLRYWQEGPLPNDMEELSTTARVEANSKALTYVLEKFFYQKDGMFHQKRIDREMEEASDNKKKRTDRAKKAAEARWSDDASSNAPSNASSNASSNATSTAQAMHNECPSSSSSQSQSNSSSASPPITPPKGRTASIDFSFIEDTEWRDLFTEWAKNKKNPYRKQIGAEKGFSYLRNLSDGDIASARRIVDLALANNWTGLFLPDDMKPQEKAPAKTEFAEVTF